MQAKVSLSVIKTTTALFPEFRQSSSAVHTHKNVSQVQQNTTKLFFQPNSSDHN